MPKLDFDVITLGHGSGGLLTNKLLDSGVFDLLQNDLLDKRHDGATLSLQGATAFTTDSFVISPIFFPGGNIGELAVNGTVNDLAMCGAIPQYLSLSFIIEEGLRMEDFWKILVSIKFACEAAGVQVVTGDTKVVERGKGDQIFINTTGVGRLHERARIGTDRIRPGDQIIVSDQLATHGIAIMSVRKGLEFETSIESDTRPLHRPVRMLLDNFGPEIHLLRDPTRGGVATVLSEIARDTRLGIDIRQKDIPVAEQVSGACEILGLDPLYVANEGIFLTVADASVADRVVDQLRQDPACRHAAVIGEVVEAHPRQVVLTSGIGGKRVVNMLTGEQLPRIC
ncbi:hydrogenase expression/formation protein HypE [Flavilitoribacter nigricans DSM 23189 = NBRC 102662]|uniref:Hydrogenase expression/formation protein HypE n=2 Tax=Flavilitoribacter TaxID=2762562 RepID=A0A2D0N5U9_FLAN2|nr:hydrogenase expression/formation protein HypE [Flavilitoribacter nigricans DSM 23189 = NBRC 102662]